MELDKRNLSEQEKHEEVLALLEKLREKLHSENISKARRAAHMLAWMQEDGLEILKEALYRNSSRITKIAAAYGLRKMQGRMKIKALEVFEKGLKRSSRDTQKVCQKALLLLTARSQDSKTPPT